ncbi:MAG: hypothetical protein AB1746_14050 [Candidatus Zixiibacteriota bacterium]
MKIIIRTLITIISISLIILGCTEKAPSRDEIPIIKNFLAKFEQAVKDYNAAQIDSMIIAEAYDDGYNSAKILEDVYQGGDAFYTFGNRNFDYIKDKAVVQFNILADSTGTGRPAEMLLVKKHKQWYLKRFDVK